MYTKYFDIETILLYSKMIVLFVKRNFQMGRLLGLKDLLGFGH